MKRRVIILTFIGTLIIFSVFFIFRKIDRKIILIKKPKPVLSLKPQIEKEILTYWEIDSVLNSFEKIPFEKLDQAYIDFYGYNQEKFKSDMAGKIFYKIKGGEVFKNLVGIFEVKDFMPKDNEYRKNLNAINSKHIQYLCIDKEVLHRFLDFILMLKQRDYDMYAFEINDGFRYPVYNKFREGASNSQHIYGKAIDLAVGDVNKDGIYDEATDKQIVLDYLENYIIKETGGVGRYPDTNAVHFDTRGYYKRWDIQ